MSKIGYARVSTNDQKLDSQIDMLKSYGCGQIFSEKVSGRKHIRTELDRCLDYMREGDTLVLTKLDRLGRTTRQLIELSQLLENRSIDLEIIDININTKDARGKMFFTMMSAFAELEENLLNERNNKALESARARGKMGGRPKISIDKERMVISLYKSQEHTINEIISMTNVSRGAIYRIINEWKRDEK